MTVERVALATSTEAWQVDEDAPYLSHALVRAGVAVTPAVWDDASTDWSSFDLVVIRSTWDYTSRLAEFLEWVARVESATTIANPLATIRWNTDKHYLGELSGRGVAVVPTSFLDADAHPGRAEVAALISSTTSDGTDVVVKPTVSAGSKDTSRYTPAQHDQSVDHALGLLSTGRDVMVQPYLSSVDVAGETGMVLLDGVLSHAFRKGALLRDGPAAVDGLFAVEEISATTPDVDEVELAHLVLDAATTALDGVRPRYARVDVLRSADGSPQLLELELTEPSFFLWTAPEAADRVAAAIRGWA